MAIRCTRAYRTAASVAAFFVVAVSSGSARVTAATLQCAAQGRYSGTPSAGRRSRRCGESRIWIGPIGTMPVGFMEVWLP
jgi:hypothetical protein